MNISRLLKVAAAVIGFLAVPVVGISTVPEQNSPGLHTVISQSDSSRTEGDSNPQPVPTVTRYLPAPTPANSARKGACRISLVVGPAGSAPTSVPSGMPYAGVLGLVHTHSVQVKVPCPTATETEAPTSTK